MLTSILTRIFILDSSLSLDETTDEIIDEDAVLGVSFGQLI